LSTIANVDAKDFSDLACWLIVQIGPIAIRGHSIGPTAQQIESIAQAFYKAARDKTVPPAKRLEFRIEDMRGRALGLAVWRHWRGWFGG
jgi:hypothetical protein